MQHKMFVGAVLSVSLALPTAVAAYNLESGGIYYDLNSSSNPPVATVVGGDNPYSGDITIPATVSDGTTTYAVTAIGNAAFASCTSVTSVTLPSGLLTINDGAFWDCTGLTSVKIPDTVTSIGESAFLGCLSATDITIGSGVTTIGRTAFSDCPLIKSIYIPASVTSMGSDVFSSCNELSAIAVDPANKVYSSEDGVLYDRDMTTLIQCPATKAGEFVVPETVRTIGRYAFGNCFQLTTVIIPPSVSVIDVMAFYQCTGLKYIYCQGQYPALCDGRVFYNVSKDCVLLVPGGSEDAYKAADEWKNFTNIYAITDVTSIELDRNVITGERGEKYQLSYTLLPDGSTDSGVKWATSDSSVASVTDDGEVTITGRGIAEVTATTTNGHSSFCVVVGEQYFNLLLSDGDEGSFEVPVAGNSTPKVGVNASAGYVVHSVSLDGTDVTSQLTDGSLSLPAVTADRSVKVVYEAVGTGVQSSFADTAMTVTSTNGGVIVSGAPEGWPVIVYGIDGRIETSVAASGPVMTISLSPGVKILTCAARSFKFSI